MSDPKNIPFQCRSRFRIMAGRHIALGPGKVDLLEAIDRTGSISRAAREMKLSYRRAWGMVDTMNRCFQSPLVSSTTGGKAGGGAQLTPLGHEITRLYRDMESKAAQAVEPDWQAIRKKLQLPAEEDPA